MIQKEPLFCNRIDLDLKAFLESRSFDHSIVLCDSNTAELCLPLLKLESPRVIVIPAGEENKNFNSLQFILEHLVRYQADRNTVLVCLGGGVITDIGGFAASVFKRGIPAIYIPTTLLAMVDAAIGGKTGIDFLHLKNYIGCFSIPEAVLLDTVFLKTLDPNEIRSAWAEIIKIAAIADKPLFDKIKWNADIHEIIPLAIKRKLELVNSDFFDVDKRQLLNFGHSIGHAYESYFLSHAKPVLHGFAVAKGMLLELKIAQQLKMISAEEAEEIENVIHEKVGVEAIHSMEINHVFEFIEADKKNLNQSVVFSLPDKIGSGKTGIKIRPEELKNWKNRGII